MSVISLSSSQIDQAYDLDHVVNTIESILEQEGMETLLRYAQQTKLSAKGKAVRQKIVEQMCIAAAWSGSNTLPENIHHILTRCFYLDELSINDPMKGSYTQAAPFLVVFYMLTTFPVMDCLYGRQNLKNLAFVKKTNP